MNDERGQALALAVMLVAIAAVGIVGLRALADRWLAAAHLERTTAGASFAAVTELADVYIEWRGEADDDNRRARRSLVEALAEPATIDRVRATADRIASANGLARVHSVRVTCADGQVDVFVLIDAQEARSGFPAPECSRR